MQTNSSHLSQLSPPERSERDVSDYIVSPINYVITVIFKLDLRLNQKITWTVWQITLYCGNSAEFINI